MQILTSSLDLSKDFIYCFSSKTKSLCLLIKRKGEVDICRKHVLNRNWMWQDLTSNNKILKEEFCALLEGKKKIKKNWFIHSQHPAYFLSLPLNFHEVNFEKNVTQLLSLEKYYNHKSKFNLLISRCFCCFIFLFFFINLLFFHPVFYKTKHADCRHLKGKICSNANL